MLRGDWIVNAEVVVLANLEFIFYSTICDESHELWDGRRG